MAPAKLLTTQHARDVVASKIIACRKVTLACQRHLNDLERRGTKGFPWVFDEKLAYRPIEFIETFCKPSQGDFNFLRLLAWQHFVIGSLYGWVHKKTKLRRFKEGLIFVGRKNGKTTMVSGLSIYAAGIDGEKGARVYQLANSMKQARLTYDECKAMIAVSPHLKKYYTPMRDAIHFDLSFSKIEPQASDSERLDGLNTHLGIFDELAEYRNYKLINVIKNSRGARKQPLILYITTAGYVLDGPLMDYYDKGADILEGVITDERSFYYMAELDKDDDVENPDNYIKATPSLGVTVKLEDMIEEWNTQKHIPAERNDFITKRLNIFVQSAEQSFVTLEVIKRNDRVMDLAELRGRSCIGGFDLSSTEDFTSSCLEFPLDDGYVFILSHSFVPRRKVELDNENLPFEAWRDEGLLTICPGDYVDYRYVYNWFMEQAKLYGITKITYDPANAFPLVQELKRYGGEEWTQLTRQGWLTISPSLKHVKELLLDGKVIFGPVVNGKPNPLMLWYINNVKLAADPKENWMPKKQGKYRKIDGFAAWVSAHTETMKLMSEMQNISDGGGVGFISAKELMGR